MAMAWNFGKMGAIGAGIGMLAGGPPGALLGMFIGGAIGGLLNWIGGLKLAKAADWTGNIIKETWNKFIDWVKNLWWTVVDWFNPLKSRDYSTLSKNEKNRLEQQEMKQLELENIKHDRRQNAGKRMQDLTATKDMLTIGTASTNPGNYSVVTQNTFLQNNSQISHSKPSTANKALK
jgi:hypothetical protein